MLLMSVVSVMAEESETFYMDFTGSVASKSGAHFNIIVDDFDMDGMFIHDGNKITINSINSEKITKVECHISFGGCNADLLRVNFGDKSVKLTPEKEPEIEADVTISDVEATSLEIYSDVVNDYLQIADEIIVYYESGNGGNNTVVADPTIADVYKLTETFPTSGNSYSGDNIKVETNSDELYIGNGNTVTISPNNGVDVRIFEVELELNSNFNGTFENLGDATVDGIGTNRITISDIYSPSLTISSTSAAEIKSINVHYVKMSEEQSVTIATTNGKKYIRNNITVVGTSNYDPYGLNIDKKQRVTIISNRGALISKVEFHLSSRYFDNGAKLDSELGDGTHIKPTGSDRDWTISNINSSSVTTTLTVYHTGEKLSGENVRIDRITVYYKEPVAPTEIQLVAASAEGAYWTTFYSNACHYQAPVGTEVYKVNLSGSTITMNKINDGIVTKGQGVVLKSLNSANITLAKADDPSSDNYNGNSLWGTSTQIPNPGNAYVLSYKDTKGLAFYKLKSTGKIPANKAYLLVPSGSSASAQAFFAFDASTTTGVENINAQDSSELEEKVYDLQGRRVAKPAKGLYIVNGKKVIMK